MRYSIIFLLTTLSFSMSAQEPKTSITLEDIWKNYTFSPRFIPGFNFQLDGRHYTRQIEDKIGQFDLLSGEPTKLLLDASQLPKEEGFNGQFQSYSFSPSEQKILLKDNITSIYRLSSKENVFLYDLEKEKLTPIDVDQISHASLSPNEDKVAYVKANNIYIQDLKSGKNTQVTKDGKANMIINGFCDWVYEEEFGFSQAYQWSPDGKTIAFIRFDESQVKEFIMPIYDDNPYPEFRTFKYPKVGEKNSSVSLHLYDVENEKTIKADLGDLNDQYIPRIKWTNDANQLVAFKMNRHQNDLTLFTVDAKTGKRKTLLHETNKYYIDITDNLYFFKDNKHFLWTSEKDGYNHIYRYNMKGKLVNQITKGKFDVTQVYGVDEKDGKVYFQSAEVSPLERHVYSIDVKGKNKKDLTPQKGFNAAQFSSTYDYFINTYSTANTPYVFTVYDNKGKTIRVIEENASLSEKQKAYEVTPIEFMTIPNSSGDQLNAYMIKPPNFNKANKYPVLMYVYGGPGFQTVEDSYMGSNYWWFQMMAQKGYIVVSVDNRGSGARGEAFKKMTYLQLGKYETEDQIDAAKYLGKLDYIDESRIGIFGWSYGGYMSSLCLFKGNDVFKSAIAVAPVTNWKWYDSIYTERYMRTEKENPEGYKENSPVYFADQLKGNYLLIHGTADDNVHFQNAAEMAKELIKANKQFDTYFYTNRNHGIYGDNARLHLYQKMTNFLLEKL